MAHHYQKRWVLTWNSDSEGQQKLIKFLNEIVEEGIFQHERVKKQVNCICKVVSN